MEYDTWVFSKLWSMDRQQEIQEKDVMSNLTIFNKWPLHREIDRYSNSIQ